MGQRPPRFLGKLTLTSHHVPFAIYAPDYFSEGRMIDTTSLVDPYHYPRLVGVPHATKPLKTFSHQMKNMFIDSIYRGLLDDEFFLHIDPQGIQRLYRYRSNSPLADVKDLNPKRAAEMAQLYHAIQETSKYLLFHNRPADPPVLSE
jgi:hypothetical protein